MTWEGWVPKCVYLGIKVQLYVSNFPTLLHADYRVDYTTRTKSLVIKTEISFYIGPHCHCFASNLSWLIKIFVANDTLSFDLKRNSILPIKFCHTQTTILRSIISIWSPKHLEHIHFSENNNSNNINLIEAICISCTPSNNLTKDFRFL